MRITIQKSSTLKRGMHEAIRLYVNHLQIDAYEPIQQSIYQSFIQKEHGYEKRCRLSLMPLDPRIKFVAEWPRIYAWYSITKYYTWLNNRAYPLPRKVWGGARKFFENERGNAQKIRCKYLDDVFVKSMQQKRGSTRVR